MMEALSSTETSALARAIWRNIPEDANLHSHRRENLRPYLIFVLLGSKNHGRMPSSGMLRRVALVRTDVSEERSASITRVTRIGELSISSQRASVTS
jgi:hypothetical protein